MIKVGQRLPMLYEQKGRILKKSGRNNDAIPVFKLALAELEKLPSGRRNTLAMQELRASILVEVK